MNNMWIRRNKKRDVRERMENKPADQKRQRTRSGVASQAAQDPARHDQPHQIRRGIDDRKRSGAPSAALQDSARRTRSRGEDIWRLSVRCFCAVRGECGVELVVAARVPLLYREWLYGPFEQVRASYLKASAHGKPDRKSVV